MNQYEDVKTVMIYVQHLQLLDKSLMTYHLCMNQNQENIVSNHLDLCAGAGGCYWSGVREKY